MKCEDFKKYMADLCDKQTDPAIAEACRQHMKECASCRAYYEDFMQTVDLLTPKHSPEFGKQKTVITLQPSQPQGASQQKLIRRILQVAAAIAIFLAGVGTGLSNLFSTQAEAVTAIPLVFEQSIQKVTRRGKLLHVYLRPYHSERELRLHQSGIRIHAYQYQIHAARSQDILED